MTAKLTVAVLFGGRSNEHSISCATARGVLQAIDSSVYNVIPIGITRDGAFTLASADPADYVLTVGELPEVEDNGTRIVWPESVASRELWVSGDGVDRSLGTVDIVFPILHGPFGEDGTIQGMLELFGLPYVGSGVLASSLGMDKHFTKVVLQAAGIDVAPWRTVNRFDWGKRPQAIRAMAEQMTLPVFIKPARAGSSVGVSKVSNWEDFAAAMDVAFAEDDHVLIEAGVVGREVECAVLQGRPGEPTRASVAGEIVITGREFYDFEAKYLDAPGIDLVCPAELTVDELAELQRLSIRAFEAIDGAGLARVDFFLTETGFVLNEINTMPGFTSISMFPRCWQETGLNYSDLIDELIQVALAHRG
ncbi:MAG: D-alanine--D-alanine ligase [Actinomycetales bacterium]|nr:D-alanine--D-alanine ligase [Actinomycetales bacterium]